MTHPRQVMSPPQRRARQRRMVTIGRLMVLCAEDAAALGNGIVNFARFVVTQNYIQVASRVNLEFVRLV